MIPFADENPTFRIPVMTVFILITMFTVWIVVQGAGFDERVLLTSICDLGMVPGEITHLAPLGSGVRISRDLNCLVDNDRINYLTPLISMFLHGGWFHILGNALFFWVFGNDIEEVTGPLRFLAFYVICGLVAAAAQIAIDPASPVPTVGASGAISGLMGAYLVLYPRVRVRTWVFLFVASIPAWAVLIYWFGLQVAAGLPQLDGPGAGLAGGVAVWAHIGGFIAGAVLIRRFVNPELVRRRTLALVVHGGALR
jgi:membrane associated rhomboid family serine protease